MVSLETLRTKGITAEFLQRVLSDLPMQLPSTTPAVQAIPTPESPSTAPNSVPADVKNGEVPVLSDEEKNKIELRLGLKNRIRSRIQEGMTRNFKDYQYYYALDLAWDVTFRQTTPTLLQSIMNKNLDDKAQLEEVTKTLTDWGLTHMITQQRDPKTGQAVGDKKALNLPVFFEVFVPLVKSYVTARWAKLCNDRRQQPFLKFEPAKRTSLSSLKCDVLTERIEVMSRQYAYFEVLKQAIFHMLHYGQCMQFIESEWDCEEQWLPATKTDVINAAAETPPRVIKVGDIIKKTVKEGLRYQHPHPTRTFKDMAHPAYTYNSDSGCMFGGYWRIMRYRDLKKAMLWNLDKISLGDTDLIGAHKTFFTSVYSGCTMAFPTTKTSAGSQAEAGLGVGALDREKTIGQNYYTSDLDDQGVLVTEYFEKLIPKENGLGDYDCPVWFRFLIAGDGATILYACPLPSSPIVYFGYDADENRELNASMSAEILPFQDQFTNLLTQLLLAVKQNLTNLTLIDTDQADEGIIEKLRNLGQKWFQGLNIQGYSSKKALKAQNKVMEVIQSFRFPQLDTVGLMNAMRMILDVLERVLLISAQELAQAASHEQTKEEVKRIGNSSSNRLDFTATPVDIGMEAWKRQLYNYNMAYGDGDFYATIPSDVPLSKAAVEALGFTFVDAPEHRHASDRYATIHAKKGIVAVDLFSLASTREGSQRSEDNQLAITLSALCKDLMANPMTAQAIGSEQAIALANQIAILAGLPKDFKLRDMSQHGTNPQQQEEDAQNQLKQVLDGVMKAVDQKLIADLKPLVEKMKEHNQELAAIMRLLHIAPPHPSNVTTDINTPPAIGPQGNPGMAQPPVLGDIPQAVGP